MALVKIGVEAFTVSTSVLSPDDGSVINGETLLAVFHHRSGGNIYQNISSDPTAGGATGDHPQYAEDMWQVWGYDNIKNFRMIKQSGADDAVVHVQYYGTGATSARAKS